VQPHARHFRSQPKRTKMSTSQNKSNKGNQKQGAQDQRRTENEKGDAGHGEQSHNGAKHIPEGQRQPKVELGTTKGSSGGATGK